MKALLAALAVIPCAFAADYQLKASPATVAWGYYWSAAKPVLKIKSGDTVEMQTLTTSSPTSLANNGVKPDDIQQELKTIYAEVKDKGPAATSSPAPSTSKAPNRATRSRCASRRSASRRRTPPTASARSAASSPPADFDRGRTKIIPLDLQRNVAKFAPNIEIPLHPFFGSMGVAPPESAGRINSGPPGVHAGNLDNKDLVEGTKLFIPVHVKGALFEAGDGHAGQGNGEVDITAMETSLDGTFQFIVRKDLHLKGPRGETPTHWIAMGLDPDLDQATINATREAIDFLVTEKHLSREDAYALCSVAVDFNITQAVDGTKGVHAMIPKSIFK